MVQSHPPNSHVGPCPGRPGIWVLGNPSSSRLSSPGPAVLLVLVLILAQSHLLTLSRFPCASIPPLPSLPSHPSHPILFSHPALTQQPAPSTQHPAPSTNHDLPACLLACVLLITTPILNDIHLPSSLYSSRLTTRSRIDIHPHTLYLLPPLFSNPRGATHSNSPNSIPAPDTNSFLPPLPQSNSPRAHHVFPRTPPPSCLARLLDRAARVFPVCTHINRLSAHSCGNR